MRNLTILVLILVFISCSKKDKINHYLVKPITQEELLDNGFYKYSYSTLYDSNGNTMTDTTKFLVKYDMYSNVKPIKNDENQLCPTQLWHFYHEDSIIKKRNKNYLKNKLNDRIITYFFRNDTLLYKDIIVNSIDKSRKEIADFTSLDKVIRYYEDLKISIKPQIKNKETGEVYSNRFIIDNYKTRFYTEDNFYEMFVDYKGDNYHAVLDHLYGGTYCQ